MEFPTATATQVVTPAAAANPGSMAGNLFSTAVSLALVLAVIFAIAWLMRWMQRARIGGASSLRINGGIQVGARERVLMVQAGDKHLLIGVAPGRVQTLHVFDQAPVMPEAQSADLSPFAERLRQLIQSKVSK
jgi:flagellar protein FliO/FliZ